MKSEEMIIEELEQLKRHANRVAEAAYNVNDNACIAFHDGLATAYDRVIDIIRGEKKHE